LSILRPFDPRFINLCKPHVILPSLVDAKGEKMECIECEECGSVISCEFKSCPYCDFQIKKGRFRSMLAVLTGNAALEQSRKNPLVFINVD
jgi:hypothetical protein